jgi:hypothetical protein
MAPLKNKILLSLQAQRKEKERGPPLNRAREKGISKENKNSTCQRTSVTIAIRWDIMQEIASVRKEREDFMHLLLMLMKNLKIKEQGNPTMSN